MEGYLRAARRVMESGRYINGPSLRGLEELLCETTGARYCVGVSTGLDALRLILLGYMHLGRLKPGDEVIVAANTFIATFLAVTHCGLTAVAADVSADSFCFDFGRLPLTERTKAIIPVHLYGNVCHDAEAFASLRRRGILIIEDNAQAIGAGITLPDGSRRSAGNLGDAAAISFYPAKNVGAFGDAGAVLTSDEALADTVRKLANYGSAEKYRHELCGFNCRMDELQAALLAEKLPALDAISERRRRNALLYDSLIENPDVTKPRVSGERESQVWHQYVIRHPRRDALRTYLADNGVGTEIHYPVACHRQPCYHGHPLLKTYGPLPTAERLADEVLSLPIADVSPQDITAISELINKFQA